MSNIFKNKTNDKNSSSNRFSFLDDSEVNNEKITKKETKKKDENESFLNKKNYFKTDNKFDNDMQSNDFKVIEKKNKKYRNQENNDIKKENIENKPEKKQIKLEINDFPELIKNNKNKDDSNDVAFENDQNKSNFKDLFNKKEIQETNEVQDEIIPDGYLCISYDKMNRKINYRQGKMNTNNKILSINERMHKICNVYEKRKNEYIDKWGEEDYENTFKFPNYDYLYFDKLDYQYEMEIEQINEEIELEDQLNMDYFDDYNKNYNRN